METNSNTHCDPDLYPALALVQVLARSWSPCLAVFLSGLAILVAHADLALAVATAADLELPDVPVVELELASERLRLPVAVVVSAGQLGHPADVAQNAAYPAA